MRIWCAIVVTALVAIAGLPAKAAPSGPSYEFRNGQVWNGRAFEARTFYVVDGLLAAAPPRRVDERIDLAGKFVIPPLAEGHNHWIEPDRVDDYISCYLADGVFYVGDHSNVPSYVVRFRDRVNLPTSVDYVSSMQGFTGPGGHPVEVMDQMRAIGMLPSNWTDADYDGHLTMIVESERDIDARWPVLMRANPAFVKVFLLYSEVHAQRVGRPEMRGKSGMDPRLLPHIVRRAHAEGLQVSAHVYSAPDFRTAVRAGADWIAHFPGEGFDPTLGDDHFLLRPEDGRLAAEAGVQVFTTLSWLTEMDRERPELAQRVRREIMIPNLRLLKAHGVPILLGSDIFRQSSLPELLLLGTLGVFTNAELLQMATENTTRILFPNRRLGRLADGYEADFLVLDRNPIENLENIRSISMRVKQGRRLTLPAAALARTTPLCF